MGNSAFLTDDVNYTASPLPSLLPARAFVRCKHSRAPSGSHWSDGLYVLVNIAAPGAILSRVPGALPKFGYFSHAAAYIQI
jgi:hypothetical protein